MSSTQIGVGEPIRKTDMENNLSVTKSKKSLELGQGLVEFSLIILILLALFLGTFEVF